VPARVHSFGVGAPTGAVVGRSTSQGVAVPESRIRKKGAYTAPTKKSPAKVGNPRWLVPSMLAFFLIGLAWIVVFYVSAGEFPLRSIAGWQVGNFNLLIGFGFVAVGFALSTRWK
jgi:hypothetical protein